tara:strand:- start:3620 stop:4471 length:852 start_codon:yes stop_codon:yes gene_type:complete
MKISRKQIRRIVEQEVKRELPISYYSDEILVQEGLMDLLGSLFGGLVKLFTGAGEEAQKDVGKAYGDAEGEVNSLATKLLGKEEAKDIKTFDDLDMEEEDHQKIYYASVAPVATRLSTEAGEDLESTAPIKDWTPADDSEEAVDKWEEENGEASTGLYKAMGTTSGQLKFFADKGVKAAATVNDKFMPALESGNPAEAAMFTIEGQEVIASLFDFAKSAGIKAASGAIEAAEAAAAKAKAVGKAIEESGKEQAEQQQESLELRKMINHMIIQERKIIKGNSGR